MEGQHITSKLSEWFDVPFSFSDETCSSSHPTTWLMMWPECLLMPRTLLNSLDSDADTCLMRVKPEISPVVTETLAWCEVTCVASLDLFFFAWRDETCLMWYSVYKPASWWWMSLWMLLRFLILEPLVVSDPIVTGWGKGRQKWTEEWRKEFGFDYTKKKAWRTREVMESLAEQKTRRKQKRMTME